jgi:two-component sensor histidine kinase
MAERFGRGDYSRDVEAFDRAPMELRALAERFDTMAAAIELRDAELVDAADRNLALAREVNHRVKNNLQIVTSLVAMQASEVREPAARTALELTRARIAAIGVIHKLLYDERDQRMGTIDLTDLSEALCAQLRTSLARQLLTLKCTSNGGRIPLDLAVPVSLFLVQGMSDALAHARREGQQRHVNVQIDRKGNSLSVDIIHTGPPSDVPLAEVEFRHTLMDIYAQQMKGALTVEEDRDCVRLAINAPIPAGECQES